MRPVSRVAGLVQSRLEDATKDLAGLDDYHLKVLSYFLTEGLKISNYKFEIDCFSKPKTLTIRCFTVGAEPRELFVEPKDQKMLDSIREFYKLNEWRIAFAKKAEQVSGEELRE